jgi:Uncharacterized protein, 4-oxalocrotonate tautomerase homolog
MPTVKIELWAGKTKELKDSLAQDITNIIVKHIGCPPEGVTIVFDERPKADWYTGR